MAQEQGESGKELCENALCEGKIGDVGPQQAANLHRWPYSHFVLKEAPRWRQQLRDLGTATVHPSVLTVFCKLRESTVA